MGQFTLLCGLTKIFHCKEPANQDELLDSQSGHPLARFLAFFFTVFFLAVFFLAVFLAAFFFAIGGPLR